LTDQLTEWLGFITGAACVWLVVRQNVWNYPIGIANNIFFLVLFTRSRLFGDAGLQVVYMVLALHGWYMWLRGGATHTGVRIERASVRLLSVMALLLIVGTAGLTMALQAAKGASPFFDALTTALSLVAQFLQNTKKLEHWLFWIAADVFYIYLYVTRGLTLTAVLYFVFLCMCIVGLVQWRKSIPA
jgi:nicotinamide mononucleotide transporter